MKRWLGLGLLGVVAYGLFALTTVPASLAYHWARPYLGGVRLYGLEGTVWSGHSQLLQVQNRRLGVVAWQFQPAALWRARLVYRIDLEGQDGRGTADVGVNWDTTKILRSEDFPVTLLAPLLGQVAPPLVGTAAVDLAGIRVRQGALISGDGHLAWNRAGLDFDTPVALGNLRVDVTTTADGIGGSLSSDSESPLGVSGTITLAAEGRYQLALALGLRERADEGLAALLSTLGDPDDQGNVNLRLSGRLNL